MKFALFALIGSAIICAGYFFWQRYAFQHWLTAGEEWIASYRGDESEGERGSVVADWRQRPWPPLLKDYLSKVIKRSELASCRVVRFRQSGFFRMEPKEPLEEFSAKQVVSLQAPMFSWQAQVMAKGLPVTVCDRLISGEGNLEARLLGAIRVAKASGPEILRGELLRYLAELPWYPAAIVHQPQIRWRQLDDSTVKGSMTVAGVTASVEYRFKDSLITSIYVPDRERMVGTKAVPTPWLGQFSDYQLQDGLLVPASGEVSWLLPSGTFTYFKGRVSDYRLYCDERDGD